MYLPMNLEESVPQGSSQGTPAPRGTGAPPGGSGKAIWCHKRAMLYVCVNYLINHVVLGRAPAVMGNAVMREAPGGY